MSPKSYFFQWQNSILRKTIYPYREMKLKDFLLIYQEVDLWASLRNQDVNDPVVSTRLKELEEKTRQERDQVYQDLQIGIQSRMQTDTWFALIKGADEKNLRFKRIYYLDRMTIDNTQRLADLESKKKSYLSRKDWYPANDERRQTWEGRACELDAPIAAIRQELDAIVGLRNLFDREARLPRTDQKKSITVADLARAELSEYRRQLELLDHDALVKKVWERLNEKLPDGKPRFEKWLSYMVIHFSGMRYMSAHGSWADPDDLLELLVREEYKGKLAPGEDIDDKTEAEIHRLMNLPVEQSTRGLIPSLKALVYFKQQKERAGDPIPDWVWDEIVKYTQLRIGTDSENWETISPERWKYENRRWREIMVNWQREDITIWRKEHKETLDLIVTRAVCNEIAEHIQHLRGNTPAAGLTSKPTWYLRLQEKSKGLPAGSPERPERCYFRHAERPGDFINGASVFWLGWVEREPNAWQVARQLTGIELWPGLSAGSQPEKPKAEEPRKKKAAATAGLPDGWSYQQTSSAYTRTRKTIVQIPTVQELRKKGMTDREIDQYRKTLRTQSSAQKEYLRWKHEATVVDIVDLIDGKYVLTFETGKIGLNWHHVDNLVSNPFDRIFVGYLPPARQEPENLAGMLDMQKILKVFPPMAAETLPRDVLSLSGEPEEEYEVVAEKPEAVAVEQPAQVVEKFYVYIITNRLRKTLFAGVTRDMKVRVFEHRHGLLPGIQKRRKLNRLVYYQAYTELKDALDICALIERFSLKERKEFISNSNPNWRDLFGRIVKFLFKCLVVWHFVFNL